MSRAFVSMLLMIFALQAGGSRALEHHQPAYQTDDNEHFPLQELPTYTSEIRRSEAKDPMAEQKWKALRSEILADFGNRMTPEFLVPEGLRERTAFWFDIYTRYGEAHHIIHHVRYPWIVFKVFDGSVIFENGKGPLWLRRDRASKLAKQEMAKIRTALKKLSRKKSYAKLKGLELELFKKLESLPGPRRKVFAMAASNVRSQLGQRDFFQAGLVNSSRYLPYMENEFRRLRLPIELTRMPFVESSFNENAFSKVGASGIWQIMPKTGKAYMIVNKNIDERNAPLKATVAAGRLLQSYFKALDSWPLAITSYNHGIGNIQKAIRGAKSRDISEIIARYHKGDFKFASSNFYTCFLAALYAERYHEMLFKEIPREPVLENEVLKLASTMRVRSIQKITGLSADDLLRYNLDIKNVIRANGTLPKGFRLHLPLGLSDRIAPRIGTNESLARGRSS